MGLGIIQLNWTQVSSGAFNEANGNFMIFPTIMGTWELHSKVKGKFYRYVTLKEAFIAAWDIANFYKEEHSVA